MPMNVVLYRVTDASELDAFHRRAESSERMTVALRRDEVPGVGSVRLCIVLADADAMEHSDWGAAPSPGIWVVGAGVMRPAGRATTVQTRYAFDPLIMFDFLLDAEELRATLDLTTDQERVFDEGLGGRLLPPKTSELVWDGLLRLAEGDRGRLRFLSDSIRPFTPLSAAEGRILLQERDAVMLATEIFGAGNNSRGALRYMSRGTSSAPFLARVADAHQLEDQVINKDARNFLDWIGLETEHAAAMTFHSGQRALTVVNANKGPIETTTGADLVYYNHSNESLVLVQYKMMELRSPEWVYYPDNQFELERQRLIAVEAIHQQSAYDSSDHLSYRLGAPVTYFKFCRRNAGFDVNDLKLMQGSYVPTEYVQSLMASMHGQRGAARIVEGPLKARSLGNTSFAALVATGLIGTRGTATDDLIAIVGDALRAGHTMVVGVETGTRATSADVSPLGATAPTAGVGSDGMNAATTRPGL